ncbi:hypothetical protein ARTHRO9V_190078 [Arthrobacter sp. 9V]|nr:hypothetical protein ARTHRO9V_190078 [Arthrobacter sp. 9V]
MRIQAKPARPAPYYCEWRHVGVMRTTDDMVAVVTGGGFGELLGILLVANVLRIVLSDSMDQEERSKGAAQQPSQYAFLHPNPSPPAGCCPIGGSAQRHRPRLARVRTHRYRSRKSSTYPRQDRRRGS